MKIGKNNELDDNISDLAGGITDRGYGNGGYVSGRSYDEYAADSIFEDRLIGSNNKILGGGCSGRTNDIIDFNERDIPIELLGETGL